MASGKVKWFNNAKGYGFILPGDGGDDLFAHYSSIQMDGYKTLKAGQDVEFDVVDGPKGSHAVAIRLIEALEEQAPDVAVPEVILPDDADGNSGVADVDVDVDVDGNRLDHEDLPGHAAES